ncbi:MAG: serine hydrolase domain-containing protein [Neisseriaceae bacterium]
MKLKYLSIILSVFLISSSNVYAKVHQSKINKSDDQLKAALKQYLNEYGQIEHISAISVNISPSSGVSKNLVAGSSTRESQTQDVNEQSLFQIGSITKSFTAAVILRLEEQGKLNINDKVGKFFPEYKEWANVTIKQLLNMTAGLDNYSETKGFYESEGHSLQTHFMPNDIIKLSYGKKLTPGYYYSNTNYILAGMIASKVSGKTFPNLMNELIKDAGLFNTYYVEDVYPKDITKRMVSGYYYNLTNDNINHYIIGKSDPLCSLGKKTTDLKCGDMSWAGAAGGIVSNPTDVSKWARELYTVKGSSNNKGVLNAKSLIELRSFVSMSNGNVIKNLNQKDPSGFGLGVGSSYKPGLGIVYFYQGETLGYRVLYVYFPQNSKNTDGKGLVITVALNSQPVDCANHINELLLKLYQIYKKTGK